MPKAVRENKSRRKHRKAEFENYYNKEKEIGTSVTKFEEEDFKCLKKKNQVIPVTSVPKESKQTFIFTMYNWKGELLSKENVIKLVWNRPTTKVSLNAIIAIRKIIGDREQEFEEDLYLTGQGMIAINYVADKWGFTKYACNGHPGKTALNTIKKRYLLISGGRMYFFTPKLESDGVIHTNGQSGNKNNDYDYEIYLKQKQFVDELYNSDKRRQLFVCPEWMENLIRVVDGIKGNYVKLDENGQPKLSKNGKHILYDLKNLRKALQEVIEYKQFEPYKERVKEILDNYPKTSTNQ